MSLGNVTIECLSLTLVENKDAAVSIQARIQLGHEHPKIARGLQA